MATMDKMKGKAQNDFNRTASLNAKRDNTETLSKQSGQKPPEGALRICEAARAKKGAEIHKQATRARDKGPSPSR